jgi:hypothetical protein
MEILSQIEAFSKNKHRHIVDISEPRASLTGALIFENNEELGEKSFLGQSPRPFCSLVLPLL